MKNSLFNENLLLQAELSNKLETINNLPAKYGFSDLAIAELKQLTLSQATAFPELIRVGSLSAPGKKGEYETIPALMPLSGHKGICFFVSDDIEQLINQQIELLVFRLLLSLPLGLVKINSFSQENLVQNFFYLSKIKHNLFPWFTLGNQADKSDILTKISNISAQTCQIVLDNNFESLAAYNVNNNTFLPYQLLFLHNFPLGFNQKSFKALLDLLENCHDEIFVVMSLKVDIKSEFDSAMRQQLLSYFTGIFHDKKSNFFKVRNLGEQEKIFNELFYLNLEPDCKNYLENALAFINAHSPVYNIRELISVDKAILTETSDKVENAEILREELTIESLIPQNEIWLNRSHNNLKIPIGINPDARKQYLILGREKSNNALDAYHALILGMTGSGKSVLLHNIITNIAYAYSPDEVNLLLLDYKQGNEFKVYRNLPHISVLSITNEREFGLKVLTALDEEIRRRGKIFNQYENVYDLESYCEISKQSLPRLVLIIDEFQVLLQKDDQLAKQAREYLDVILRMGRSFGINVILSTQTLAGKNLNLANIGLRIALQMSEADSEVIFDKDNPGAKEIKRQGEAIYNAYNGSLAGNMKFFFPDFNTTQVANLINRFGEMNYEPHHNIPQRYIYDGSSDIVPNKEQQLYQKITGNNFEINNAYCDIYTGKEMSGQEQELYYRLRSQFESNLLIIGEDEESVVSVLLASTFQLLKQGKADSKIYLLNLFNVDSEYSGCFELFNKYENIHIGNNRKIESYIEEVYAELEQRQANEGIYDRLVLQISNLENARRKLDLKRNPQLREKLLKLLIDGPELGIHTIIYSPSYEWFVNILGAEHLAEFENRIIFAGNDSLKALDKYASFTVFNKGIGILQSPHVKYKTTCFKVYDYQSFYKLIYENQ